MMLKRFQRRTASELINLRNGVQSQTDHSSWQPSYHVQITMVVERIMPVRFSYYY
jgi:hypothetical protein